MKNKEYDKAESEELRQKAEEELLKQNLPENIIKVDNSELIHELRVHQIELEMQNEELTIAREYAESAMEKFTDLYDFAPSGYVTLTKEGSIIDLNFSAASMLNNDRINLKNKQFSLYVSHESLELFNEFFEKTFRFREKQSCELLLKSSPDKPCYIHVDALVSNETNNCQMTMIDISERKKMEIELRKALDRYEGLNRYFLDRELRMIDLKKEINELLIKSGCEQEYLI